MLLVIIHKQLFGNLVILLAELQKSQTHQSCLKSLDIVDISSSEIKQFNNFIFDSIVIDFVIGHCEPFMIVI